MKIDSTSIIFHVIVTATAAVVVVVIKCLQYIHIFLLSIAHILSV